MPLINQATVDTATTGKTQGKDAVWAKQTVTIGFHRHLNLKVIVTDALMGEHSPALGGVRKSSCVRSLERGDENEFTIVTSIFQRASSPCLFSQILFRGDVLCLKSFTVSAVGWMSTSPLSLPVSLPQMNME